MVHCIPLNDERSHETTDTCWCNPRVEWIDPDTNLPWSNGGPMVIHNAEDCREVSEEVTGESVDSTKKWEVIEV